MAARPDPEPAGPGATRRDDLLWMATKGTSWCLRRSIDLIPYLLFMAAREALTEPREGSPERPATPSPLMNAVAGADGRTAACAGEEQAAESMAE
jgi:hypothetical protein